MASQTTGSWSVSLSDASHRARRLAERFGLPLAAFLHEGPLTWISLHLGNLASAATAMAGSVALYAGRNDFTR